MMNPMSDFLYGLPFHQLPLPTRPQGGGKVIFTENPQLVDLHSKSSFIAFKATPDFAAELDRVVRELDTDRSKFIRAAVRKEIAKSKAG
jgi:hypothetical protein